MSASPYDNPYANVGTNIELDLRVELNRTFNGAVDEIPKGRVGMLRRMRRDENNKAIRCECRDPQTDEPSKDYYCRYCLGMGFLWDERKMLYYKNEDTFNKDSFMFYIQYDKDINTEDYIVELLIDKEGSPVLPVQRYKIYNILEVFPYKSDNGRLEFWKVLAQEERRWSVWYGVKNRQY
jgi:hypothetical protein